MDLITKAISLFSPAAGVRRMQSQMALKVTDDYMKQRKYEGAGKGPRLGTWGTHEGSVNTEIGMSLSDLRSRARMLCQNNPYAGNAPKRIANNVVGTGILVTATHDKSNKTSESQFKTAWKKWADDTACDFNEQMNFYGIQHLVMMSLVKNGEAIVRRVKKRYKKGQIPLELQVLDPEYLDTTKETIPINEGENRIINGIEFSKGKRVAYWIFPEHPKDNYTTSKRVPAEDICHLYYIEDPGQARGVTSFSTVILRMKDFDEYEDAQLYRQKIAACFVAFRSKPATAIPQLQKTEVDARGNMLDRMSPGIIEELDAGESITFGTPPSTEGFGEYSRQNLQGQAVGLGMSYESFTGDLTGVNFSSGRMGWIEFQRNVEHFQWNIMVPMFLNKVFRWFIEAAYVAKAIPDTEYTPTWTPPRRQMIDPAKEVKSIIEEIRGGLTSWQDAVKQLGYNPEDLLAEMTKARGLFDAAGLLPECDPRYDAEQRRVKLEKEADEK